MRVLWILNKMPQAVAAYLGMEGSNKEGWIDGLLSRSMGDLANGRLELCVAFPVIKEIHDFRENIHVKSAHFEAIGFYEDNRHPERYSPWLEKNFKDIYKTFCPEVIHIFGTEYPHALAAVKAADNKKRVLIGFQGIISMYTDSYMASLPEKIRKSVTFRDVVKHDTLLKQQHKFYLRGKNEISAIKKTGNLTGRTAFDKNAAKEINPDALYFFMNETLRTGFYEGRWEKENSVEHSMFLSQGDYPLKGLHYILSAMPAILDKYPDAVLKVAGNPIIRDKSLKGRLKVSAYGKYIEKLLDKYNLRDKVIFVGRKNENEMKGMYLSASLFVFPSSSENSPNSLGEAMLLGMPIVTADVGGITTMFDADKDGIMFEGYRPEDSVEEIAQRLANAVINMWELDDETVSGYCESAREHALKTHDGEKNYQRLLEIYESIINR